MSDWQAITLGEAAYFTVGFPFRSARFTEISEDVRLLRGDNVAQRRVRWDNTKRWPKAEFDAVSQFHLVPGDIVLAMDRPWIAAGLKWAVLNPDDCPSLLVQRVLRLRAKPGVTQRFLGYVLASRAFTEHVLAVQTGTAVPHISSKQVAEFTFILPELPEQERITEVLSTLDDKIELNRRMNETLEAMAQAIFRDWFVDFGPVRRKLEGATDPVAIMGGLVTDPVRAAELAGLFPDVLTDEGLPEGWRASTLAEIALLCKGSVTPLSRPDTEFEHYSLPAFDSSQEPSIDRGDTIKSNKTPVPAGAVLLSKLNPEITRVWLPNPPVGREQISSTEFLIFLPRPLVGRGLLYCLFRDPTVRQILSGMVTGTSKSHQRISPSALLQTTLLVGHGGAFAAYERIVEPMLQRGLSLRAENRSLAETRDYLLPRLMSGEVRVGEAGPLVSA